MIDTFNMSAAFAYDGAAQFDGLHMVGPTIKTLITKLFHHVCAETIAGGNEAILPSLATK